MNIIICCLTCSSEALAVDDLGTAALVVLLLRDPHCLESRQRCQDGATEPDRVEALGGRKHLDSVVGGRQLVDLRPHALGQALEQRGAARKDNVGEQVAAHVGVALHH